MFEIKIDSENRLRLRVKVKPSAPKTKILGTENGMLVVAVAAPPEKGRANKELERFIAKTLGLSKGNVSVISGMKDRHKTLLVQGIGVEECRRFLEQE